MILLSATEATGWEDSLKRAQEAEIPVLLIDRGIEPNDTEPVRHAHRPGQRRGCRDPWRSGPSRRSPREATTSSSKGPPASASSTSATRAGTTSSARSRRLKKVGAQTANWSTEEAKSVFETVLKANNNDIQLVFAQNDEMGLGAVAAAKEAGLTPGVDVKIATIDGTKPALEALAASELSFVAEYNPLFGETAMTAVKAALAGEKVEPYIIVPSEVFASPEEAKTALPDRQY